MHRQHTKDGALSNESKTHPKFRHIDGPVAVRVEKLQKVVLDGALCAYNIGQPRFCEMVRVKVLRWGGGGGAGYEVEGSGETGRWLVRKADRVRAGMS